jgi:hypothetical protein
MSVVCMFLPMIACFATTPVVDGYSSQYAIGIMDATIEARQGWGQLPDNLDRYDVFAAVEDCRRIGDEFVVRYRDEWQLGVASDCSGSQETSDWMTNNRILIEISHDTAVEWNVVGQGGVEIEFAWIVGELPIGRCVVAL